MKLTVSQLRKIIKEEVARTLREAAGEKTYKGPSKDITTLNIHLKRLGKSGTSENPEELEDGQMQLTVHGADVIDAANEFVKANPKLDIK